MGGHNPEKEGKTSFIAIQHSKICLGIKCYITRILFNTCTVIVYTGKIGGQNMK